MHIRFNFPSAKEYREYDESIAANDVTTVTPVTGNDEPPLPQRTEHSYVTNRYYKGITNVIDLQLQFYCRQDG
jgi:hypothetical protein